MRDNREGKSDVWTERNNTPKSNKVIIPLIKNTKLKKSDLISNGKGYD